MGAWIGRRPCDSHAMIVNSMPRRTAWRGVLAGLVFVAASAPAAAAESMLGAMAAAVGPTEARRAMTGLATRADCTGPRGAFTTEIVSHGDVVRFVQVRDSGRTALLVTGTAAFARAADGASMQATAAPKPPSCTDTTCTACCSTSRRASR